LQPGAAELGTKKAASPVITRFSSLTISSKMELKRLLFIDEMWMAAWTQWMRLRG